MIINIIVGCMFEKGGGKSHLNRFFGHQNDLQIAVRSRVASFVFHVGFVPGPTENCQFCAIANFVTW
jgi:hypothetical protein